MNIQSILEHMNTHHQSEMIALCKKFGNATEVINVKLENVDFGGMDIVYNDNIPLRVEFPQKADPSTIKDAIINICKQAGGGSQTDSVIQDIQAFRQEFQSVLIASVDKDGQAICSYAPSIQIHNKLYIYISEVAEHFQSISSNPDKIEAMFLEDECKAKSILVRKRLKYRANARFVERESQEFETALDTLETRMGGGGGVASIRQMKDFHLIELQLGLGRFVKGFGQAYDVLPNGEIKHVGGNNPHTKGNPHGGHNPHK